MAANITIFSDRGALFDDRKLPDACACSNDGFRIDIGQRVNERGSSGARHEVQNYSTPGWLPLENRASDKRLISRLIAEILCAAAVLGIWDQNEDYQIGVRS